MELRLKREVEQLEQQLETEQDRRLNQHNNVIGKD